MENKPSKLVPALIGGGVMAVLSTLPIISMGNCLCCLWVLVGGGLAAYLYRRQLPPEETLSNGEGALTGLLAGVFGAIFGLFLSYFILFLGINPAKDILEAVLSSGQDLPPEFEEFLNEFQEGEGLSPIFAFLQLIVGLIVDSLFGALGGILGATFFGKPKKIEGTP